jgi:hypothetical protein
LTLNRARRGTTVQVLACPSRVRQAGFLRTQGKYPMQLALYAKWVVTVWKAFLHRAALELSSPKKEERLASRAILALTKTRQAIQLAKHVRIIGTESWILNELMKPQDQKVNVMGHVAP